MPSCRGDRMLTGTRASKVTTLPASAHSRPTAGERLSRISLTEVHAFRALAARVNPPAQCEGLSPGLVAWTIAQLVDHTDPAHAWRQAVWLSRYEAAKLYGHGGHWAQAEAQAALAWQPTADAGVGFYLAQLQARDGRLEQAQATLADVAARTHCNDTRGRTEIDRTWRAWQALRDGGRATPGLAPPAWQCRAM